MNANEILKDMINRKWTGIYLRIISVILAFSALSHIISTLGLVSNPWGGEITLPLRVLDVLLLVFNIVVAIGLWFKKSWAVIALVTGIILLHIIPFTVFGQYFTLTPEHGKMLTNLVIFDLIILSILAVLALIKK